MGDGAVVLTGAGSPVGAQLAFRLAAEGTEQRLITPVAGREPRLPGDEPLPETETFVLRHDATPDELAPALHGADTLVIAGAAGEDPDPEAIVRAAAAQEVRRIVHLSRIGAEDQAISLTARRHRRIEQDVRASGVTWTILQVAVQFSTLVRAVRDDVLRAPAGDGRVSAVSHADIADAATAVLLDERAHAHDATTYRITGPEALSGADVVATLSAVVGRTIRYEPASARDLCAEPPSAADLDAWISCCAAVDAGVYERVHDDVTALAGRPARRFARWLDDYPAEWATLAG